MKFTNWLDVTYFINLISSHFELCVCVCEVNLANSQSGQINNSTYSSFVLQTESTDGYSIALRLPWEKKRAFVGGKLFNTIYSVDSDKCNHQGDASIYSDKISILNYIVITATIKFRSTAFCSPQSETHQFSLTCFCLENEIHNYYLLCVAYRCDDVQ